MSNQITCPKCKRIIANNPVIDQAAKREGDDTQYITCECGERIGYWHIATQLSNQKKFGYKLQQWFHGLSKG
jgi:RNase P subunit RPR2